MNASEMQDIIMLVQDTVKKRIYVRNGNMLLLSDQF